MAPNFSSSSATTTAHSRPISRRESSASSKVRMRSTAARWPERTASISSRERGGGPGQA